MRRTIRMATVLALVAGLTGCGGTRSSSPSDSSATANANEATVMSCTEELTFTSPPERVLVLSETDYAILYELGLSDKVIARAGVDKVSAGEDADMRASLDRIPTIQAGNTGTGGAKITVEAALEVNPDLVIGYDSGVDRAGLAAAGVPLYTPDAFCPSAPTTKAEWTLVIEEIDKIATIFGVQDRAEALEAEVNGEVAKLEKNALSGDQTAAALYLMNGSQEFYAYGTSSMMQPIFEVNGLTNVYADTSERVFDASMEALLDRDPDWIVVLMSEITEEQAAATLASLPGSADLKAVREGHVVYMPFVLTDPPTTLSVKGATHLSELIARAH